jgi:hypothetical protein
MHLHQEEFRVKFAAHLLPFFRAEANLSALVVLNAFSASGIANR